MARRTMWPCTPSGRSATPARSPSSRPAAEPATRSMPAPRRPLRPSRPGARPPAAPERSPRPPRPTEGSIARCTIGVPAAAPAAPTAAFNPEASAPGTSPSPTHAAASTPIPASIGIGDSTACSASGDRGIARNPVPIAFTNVAAASPAVSATAPTAIGIVRPSTAGPRSPARTNV